MDQTNYGEFARLDPVISQFPPLVELERIRVTLAFLKHHQYQVLLGRSEQRKRCFDSPEIDGEFPV